MSYEEIIERVVEVVEGVGVGIMVLGALVAIVYAVIEAVRASDHEDVYERLRRNLGRVILLGLEVLIIGDIVRTVVVDPTVDAVVVLGAIVVIRIVLSTSLEVEIDGEWPWRRNRNSGRVAKGVADR